MDAAGLSPKTVSTHLGLVILAAASIGDDGQIFPRNWNYDFLACL